MLVHILNDNKVDRVLYLMAGLCHSSIHCSKSTMKDGQRHLSDMIYIRSYQICIRSHQIISFNRKYHHSRMLINKTKWVNCPVNKPLSLQLNWFHSIKHGGESEKPSHSTSPNAKPKPKWSLNLTVPSPDAVPYPLSPPPHVTVCMVSFTHQTFLPYDSLEVRSRWWAMCFLFGPWCI